MKAMHGARRQSMAGHFLLFFLQESLQLERNYLQGVCFQVGFICIKELTGEDEIEREKAGNKRKKKTTVVSLQLSVE